MKNKTSSRVVSLDAPGNLLLHDNFTDTNGVLLPAHDITPFNPFKVSWIKANTVDWDILNNEASLEYYAPPWPDTAHKENDHYVDIGLTALTAEAVVRADSLTDFAVITLATRFTSSDSHFSLQYQQINVSTDPQIEFRQQNVGSSDILFTQSIDSSLLNTEVTLKLVDDGLNMTGYVNDSELFTISSSTYATATGAGIKAQSTFAKIVDFYLYKT